MIFRKPPYRPRVMEHWIYLPHGAPPSLAALAKAFPEGSTERTILRHPALHVGLILRAQNPAPFRPDAEAWLPETDPDALAALERSPAMLRLVYADGVRGGDIGAAAALALAARGVADRCRALAAYDPLTERLAGTADADSDCWSHLRLAESAGEVRVLGMAKLGYPDLSAEPTGTAGPTALRLVLRRLAEDLALGGPWRWSGAVSSELGRFRFTIRAGRRGLARVRVEPEPER